jgi:hypothetical protein
VDLSVSMPLDEGFLRRECRGCSRQFKWFHGSTDERPACARPAIVFLSVLWS